MFQRRPFLNAGISAIAAAVGLGGRIVPSIPIAPARPLRTIYQQPRWKKARTPRVRKAGPTRIKARERAKHRRRAA